MNTINTTCCVVGGGPAGMMLGFLLARAGIQTTVLEKHGDFLRDFRGDTVHPSTLELMYELGLLAEFLQLPHSKVKRAGFQIGHDSVEIADFAHVKTHCKFIAFMPQWDFLNFVSAHAKRYPTFDLHMNTAATDVIEENGRIVGVKAKAKDGQDLEVRASLVVAADGRGSVLRDAAKMVVQDQGAPMDVLWLRISRDESDPEMLLGRVFKGVMIIMLNRGDYWQCGYIIPKGSIDKLKERGIEAIQSDFAMASPFLGDRVKEIKSFDDIHLLTVKVDRLEKWHRDGFLCIGDAAHAMSPIGGVGINLAVQDAVAAANLLWKPLHEGTLTESDLQKVQTRRLYPTRMTQRMQVFIQNNLVKRSLSGTEDVKAPLVMRFFNAVPRARVIPATVIGVGFRQEHIECPEVKVKATS